MLPHTHFIPAEQPLDLERDFSIIYSPLLLACSSKGPELLGEPTCDTQRYRGVMNCSKAAFRSSQVRNKEKVDWRVTKLSKLCTVKQLIRGQLAQFETLEAMQTDAELDRVFIGALDDSNKSGSNLQRNKLEKDDGSLKLDRTNHKESCWQDSSSAVTKAKQAHLDSNSSPPHHSLLCPEAPATFLNTDDMDVNLSMTTSLARQCKPSRWHIRLRLFKCDLQLDARLNEPPLCGSKNPFHTASPRSNRWRCKWQHILKKVQGKFGRLRPRKARKNLIHPTEPPSWSLRYV